MASKTLTEAAQEALSAFTTTQRGDDTIFVLRDERPEWVYDLVYAAHGDFGPDDWRYAAIYSALSHIVGDAGSSDPDDLGHEWADSEVDIYTEDQLAWLSSNLSRVGYCDEALEEYGGDIDSILSVIGLGQYAEASEVWGSVVNSLEAHIAVTA